MVKTCAFPDKDQGSIPDWGTKIKAAQSRKEMKARDRERQRKKEIERKESRFKDTK